MQLLGLDIGYSNLKLSYGQIGDTVTRVSLPAGAGPRGTRSVSLTGPQAEAVEVQVNGESWEACIPQAEVRSQGRELADDYANSPQYTALLHAALRIQGEPVVDHVVTGLPVNLWKDKTQRQRLATRLLGSHDVAPGKTVTIKNAEIIPQPLGSYFAALAEFSELGDALTNTTTLVLDPGFFSFDYALIDRGNLELSACGSNTFAVSSLLEVMQAEIQRAGGGIVHISDLEELMRSGADSLYLGLKKTSMLPFRDAAIEAIAGKAVKDVRNKLRSIDRSVGAIILTGGGASLWKSVVAEAFPGAEVLALSDSVNANSFGFLKYGESYEADAA